MKRNLPEFAVTVIVGSLAAALFNGSAGAQQLWKYTDKDGKIVYSDKPPKNGEKAEEVKFDAKANVIESRKAQAQQAAGKEAAGKGTTVDQRVAARIAARDAAEQRVDLARQALERARKNLDDGRQPQPGEIMIAVGRGPTPGSNAVSYRPEYYSRVTALENAVKSAEKNLEEAEADYAKVK